ncbi:hypothetical protein H6504_00305 [Candidatus Woesearchaeota archaeon]|nr:hypothetical protein [Candidatus Woesearchaeota archaeon]
MRPRTTYGESKIDSCAFCDKQGIYTNSQNLRVCKDHTHSIMKDVQCICGKYMELKKTKNSAFFVCPDCGPQKIQRLKEFQTGEFKLNKKFRKDPLRDL